MNIKISEINFFKNIVYQEEIENGNSHITIFKRILRSNLTFSYQNQKHTLKTISHPGPEYFPGTFYQVFKDAIIPTSQKEKEKNRKRNMS